MSGFIAMQRDALEHPVLHDAERFRAWFWIVANAAWKPTRTRIKGQIITLEAGQLSFSVRFLAEAWGWSRSRVDRFLSELRAEGMIETCSKIGTVKGHSAGQGQSVITVCNYCKYQDPKNNERDNSDAQSGTTAGQQRDKEEQGNHLTRNNNKARASEIQADWMPSEFGVQTQSRAIVNGWDGETFDAQLEAFKANHKSKSNKFTDPQAAWSTWVLNSRKFGAINGKQSRNSNNSTQSAAERARQLLAGTG